MADGGLGGQGDLKADMEAFEAAIAKARQQQIAQAAAQEAIESGGILKSIKRMWDSLLHPRHPKGSPDGGKFSGKDGPKAKVTVDHGPDLFGGWKGDVTNPGAYATHPKPRPKDAVTHPAVDDNGDAVWIDYPSKPSPPEAWDDPKAVISFTPNSAAPASLNGVPFAPWADAPKTPDGWLNVPGQNPVAEIGWPELKAPKGKRIGAGVIIEEPDGRIWVVSPTNGFGGYRSTFPKGTYEDDIASLQANAIKEAYEESGLQVEITDVLGDFERTTSTARFYMARRVGGTPSAMGWESQATRLIPLDELPKWLNRKEVDHPIVAAIEDYMKERIYKSLESIAKAFDEGKIERWPKGSPLGGQFKSKGATGMAEPPKIGWKKDGSGPGANAIYYNKMKAAYDAAAAGDLTPAKALWKANYTYAKQFADGVKMNSHGKWKAQTAQYAMELLAADVQSKQTITMMGAIDAKLGAPKIADWKKVGIKPGGSAPGALYTDETGQKWLVKGNLQGKDDNRAKNEVLASKLMAAAGVPSPEYKLVDLGGEYGGGMGVAVKWEEGLSKVGMNPSPVTKKQAYDQFAVHAWLGNWDVVGETGDNLMRRPNNELVNIDPGGALLYRAQGVPKKPDEFGASPDDWNTMRKTGNSAAVVFGGMTTDDLQNSAMKLQGIDNATIEALVKAHGPGNASEQNALVDTLIARRDAILELNQLDPADTAPKVAAPKPEAPKVEPKVDPKVEAKAADSEYQKFAHTKVAQAFGAEINGASLAYVDVVAGMDALGEPDKGFVPKLQDALDSNIKYAAGNANLKPETKLKGLKAAAGMSAIISYHQTGKVDVEMIAEMEAELAKSVFGSEEAYTAALEGDLDADPITPPKVREPKPANDWPKKPSFHSTEMQADVDWFEKEFGPGGGITDDNKGLADTILGNTYFGGVGYKNSVEKEVLDYGKALLTKHGAIPKTAPAPSPAVEALKKDMAPAIPDFEAAKLADTNTNAPSHNAKVDVIAALTAKEDVKGLLALNYGTNTYGKKQAALANNALASLGSDEKVTPGQKAWSHPALAGATPDEASATAKTISASAPKKKPVINKADLPKKPDFQNWKGPGQGLSSKPWKNAHNQALVDQIEAKALDADLQGLKALTYEETLDNEAGEKTGKVKPFSEHPSKHIQSYWSDSVHFVDDKLNPPKPLEPAKTIKAASLAKIAEAFAPAPLMTPVHKMPANQRMGFWMALGQVKATKEQLEPAVPVFDATPEFKQAVKDAYKKADSASKSFMSSVQGSGAINDAYNSGQTNFHGMDLVKTNESLHKDAIEVPEGMRFYKWLGVPDNMLAQLASAPVGTVLQNPGSTCTSMSAFNTRKFGPKVRVNFRAAKGVKAMPSWGSPSGQSGFHSEEELTTLPGARYVLLGVKKNVMPPPGQGSQTFTEIEVVILPPHKNSLKTKL